MRYFRSPMAVDNNTCEELLITTSLSVRSLMPSNSWRRSMQWGVQYVLTVNLNTADLSGVQNGIGARPHDSQALAKCCALLQHTRMTTKFQFPFSLLLSPSAKRRLPFWRASASLTATTYSSSLALQRLCLSCEEWSPHA